MPCQLEAERLGEVQRPTHEVCAGWSECDTAVWFDRLPPVGEEGGSDCWHASVTVRQV